MGPHTSVFSTGFRSSSILLLSLPEISLSISLNYHSRPRMPSKSTVRINRAVSSWTVIPSVVGPPSPSLVEKRRQPATSQLSVAWRFWHQNGGALEEEVRERSAMEAASEELERRSRYLSSLVERTKIEAEGKEKINKGEEGEDDLEELPKNMKVRAADMPPALQRRAFRCVREALAVMPKLDSKRLALALKKEFDSSCGPAWHCVVGTSFGSYVTHSLGGFLYFSIDKVYILLFRTAVEPLVH